MNWNTKSVFPTGMMHEMLASVVRVSEIAARQCGNSIGGASGRHGLCLLTGSLGGNIAMLRRNDDALPGSTIRGCVGVKSGA
jgi:hypothetical protein